MRLIHFCSALAVLIFLSSQAFAERTWTDRSGTYQLVAELVAFNDNLAILKTAEGELLSFPISDLSDASREFLQSKEAMEVHQAKGNQKWTLESGFQLIGRLVSHEDRDVTLQRRVGKFYVNDRPFDNLPAEYKAILPKVIGHFEKKEFSDAAALEKWVAAKLGYRPRTYHCEGVKLAMENGDEFLFPYFLFAEADRKFLELGGDEFRKTEVDSEERHKQTLYSQAMAEQYHLERQRMESEAQILEQRERNSNQQIKRIEVGLLAVASGVTDLWEVAMIPRGGSIYQAQMVVVPAQNSLQASQKAVQKWPGYNVGPIRRVNGR
jgi:hypothetical protein